MMKIALSQNKERMIWMDLLKLFAIFLVLWGHSVQHLLKSPIDPWDRPLYKFIYAFHMPLFMMIAGYFATGVTKLRFKDFITKRSRQLLLPLVSFVILYWILVDCLNWGSTLFTNYQNYFWFIPSLFICTVMYYCASKLPGHKHYFPMFITIGISLLIPVYNLDIMYPSFLSGVFLRKWERPIFAKAKTLMAASLLFFFSLYYFKESAINFLLEHKIRFVTLLPVRYYDFVMGLAGSIVGITFFYLLSEHFNNSQFWKSVSRYGQYTLGVYLIQTFLLEIFLRDLLDFSTTDFYLFNFFIAPLISFIVLSACIALIKVISLNSGFSFFFLGKSYTTGTRK